MTSTHDLLVAEIDTNYVRDGRGRLLHVNVPSRSPPPLVVIGMPQDGERTVAYGALLGDDRIEAIDRAAREPGDPTARILRELGADADVRTGPVWVFPAEVPDVVLDADARVVWHEDGASQLPVEVIAELEAPWAAVIVASHVVSSCDTVRRGPSGFEAGVRTVTEHRGRGYASAATAEWGRRMHELGRPLFYATTNDNMSSQRVAQRLGLEQIGTTLTFRARPR